MTDNRTVKRKYWERNRLSGGELFQKDALKVFVAITRFILLFGLCFLILQPLINKVSVSLMEEQDLYNPLIITLPEHVTTDNYKLAALFMNYWEVLKNTFLISITIALLQIIVCTFVGYGFARFDFPFKKFWFGCVILLIVIPPQTISTSLFLHFQYFNFFGKTVNLSGSVLPYYLMSAGCMGLKCGLYIYMVRQFFRNMPKELEEAAYVDGLGTFGTFIRIMLPDAKPILVSCFLFAFVWQWTDVFYTKLFLGKIPMLSSKLSIIADTLDSYVKGKLENPAGASVGYTQCIVSTGTLMVITPILLIYLFMQKGFTESIARSGIKG